MDDLDDVRAGALDRDRPDPRERPNLVRRVETAEVRGRAALELDRAARRRGARLCVRHARIGGRLEPRVSHAQTCLGERERDLIAAGVRDGVAVRRRVVRDARADDAEREQRAEREDERESVLRGEAAAKPDEDVSVHCGGSPLGRFAAAVAEMPITP